MEQACGGSTSTKTPSFGQLPLSNARESPVLYFQDKITFSSWNLASERMQEYGVKAIYLSGPPMCPSGHKSTQKRAQRRGPK